MKITQPETVKRIRLLAKLQFCKRLIVFLLCAIAGAALAGCASAGGGPAAVNYNRDLLMGIVWQQNSGEYAALCYQAFNAGKAHINSLPAGGKRAVVLDIDETVLDNSKYAAWMVSSGSPWANETWEAWCNAAKAPAVPGALDFTSFLRDKNIEVFYITNRPASTRAATIANMQNLGFPFADESHILPQETTSDKTPRIESVKQRGFDIALYAGDNLDDFDSSIRRWGNRERLEWTEKQIGQFGAYWIVLPNAVYGTFESAVIQNYYGLPPEGKADARLGAIASWAP
jgi:5'-nucleotidase (lipoprotein e(P4) family)